MRDGLAGRLPLRVPMVQLPREAEGQVHARLLEFVLAVVPDEDGVGCVGEL